MIKETLSPRERVRLALDHQVTDRIPLAMVCSGINPPADIAFDALLQRKHGISLEVFLRNTLDIRYVNPAYIGPAFPPDTDTPQLAFEAPYKPAETKAISGNSKVLPAEQVATAILEQAARGRFMLFPGFDSWLFYVLSTKLPKGLVFAVLDQMAASGRKKKAEGS